MIEKTDITRGLRKVLPSLMACVAAILTVIQFPVPLLGVIRPDLLLALVYFWGIYRPDFLSVSVIFFASVFVDILVSPFIGLGVVLYILAFIIVRSQRRFLMGQGFALQWLCFAVIALLKVLCEWLAFSILSTHLFPAFHSLILLLFTIILYPFLAIGLLRVHKKIAD